MERGSILILTTIVVLVLSLMATGLLTVGTTELYTTQNFHLNKAAYYTAVQGVEEIRNQIYNAPDAGNVGSIVMEASETESHGYGLDRSYITGSLYNWEHNAPENITQFVGFDAPPLPGMSITTNISIAPVVWKVDVTAEVAMGKRVGYSEVTAGVYSILVTGYN